MKRPIATARVEPAEQGTSGNAPDAARPNHATPDRHRMVALRGRVIHNRDGRTRTRFALREDDGTTVALYGVYSDEDGWLVGARVEVEGWYVSASLLSVSKLIVRTP